MNRTLLIFSLLMTVMMLSRPVQAQMQSGAALDQIVAVVNDHEILKSEVDGQVQEQMIRRQQQNNPVPFTEELWYSVLRNMVERYVLLDQARIDSVTISDEEVDQQINRQIEAYVEQLGSEAAAERQLGKSIIEVRAELRQSYREQNIVQQFVANRMEQVAEVTRPEVREFFESIPRDSLPTIPEQVAISHIVKEPPARSDAREAARQLAEQLRDSVINHGKTIEELARRHSDGVNAAEGGKLPLIGIDELVPEYSAAAAALEPGEISEVVETSFGFHVIRLNRQLGDQIDTNHILIQIDQDSYDDQVAIDRLSEIRDSILTYDDVTFAAMARKYSDDPNTAPLGGRLTYQNDSRYFPLTELEPSLYRIVLLLENEGDISEPRSFTVGSEGNTREAYRIVRLDEHIPEHTANLEQDFERIKSFAQSQKNFRVRREWVEKLKSDMYIEYKIPVPDTFR